MVNAAVSLIELSKPEESPRLAREIAHIVLSELGETPNPAPQKIEDYIDNMGCGLTVAALDVNEQVLATAGLLSTGMVPEGMILNVVTAPNYRERGLGRKVLGFIEDKARQTGMSMLTLRAVPTSTGFYERLGYERQNKSIFHVKSL